MGWRAAAETRQFLLGAKLFVLEHMAAAHIVTADYSSAVSVSKQCCGNRVARRSNFGCWENIPANQYACRPGSPCGAEDKQKLLMKGRYLHSPSQAVTKIPIPYYGPCLIWTEPCRHCGAAGPGGLRDRPGPTPRGGAAHDNRAAGGGSRRHGLGGRASAACEGVGGGWASLPCSSWCAADREAFVCMACVPVCVCVSCRLRDRPGPTPLSGGAHDNRLPRICSGGLCVRLALTRRRSLWCGGPHGASVAVYLKPMGDMGWRPTFCSLSKLFSCRSWRRAQRCEPQCC